MKYTEVILNCNHNDIEANCSALEELGVFGFIIEDEDDFKDFLENNKNYWDVVDNDLQDRFRGLSRIKFYLEDDELLGRIREVFPELETSAVQDSDWENNWKEFYKPIPIGEKLIVVPQWEENPEKERIPLILDPGLIFGTGSHATTRMCLEVLQRIDLEGKRILDLGCGSGILGIGAMLLGAKECTALDIDEKAPDVVRSNAALNGVKIDAYSGDVINSRYSGYDVVIANIFVDVIKQITGNIPGFLNPGGLFLCSGIIDGREGEVTEAIKNSGLSIVEHLTQEEWHTYLCAP